MKYDLEELKQAGQRIRRLIDSGNDAKAELPRRWEQNEAYYENNRPSIGNETEEMSRLVKVHVPFSQPRQARLTAAVCGVLGRQDPYMIARDQGSGDRADRLEDALYFFWQRKPATFEANLREACTIAQNTNKALWKVGYKSMKDDPKGGLTLDVIHPVDFVCAPAITLEDARLVGNRIWKRRRWVMDKVASGEFYDYDQTFTAGDMESVDETHSIQRSMSNPDAWSEKDDDVIQIWDVWVYLDMTGEDGTGAPTGKKGKEKLYHVIFAYDDQRILWMNSSQTARHPFFQSYFISDKRNFWSGRSVAYNLQGLQSITNLYHAALYNGSMTQAMPPIFGSGLPEKYTRYGWGDVVDIKDMIQTPWAPPSGFSGAPALIEAINKFDEIGDQVANVSQNSMGATVGDTTATEQSIVAAGVSGGQEDYIANFSSSFADMAETSIELLKVNYDDWYPVLGMRPAPPQMVMDPLTDQPSMQPATNPDGSPKMVGMVDCKPDELNSEVLWECTGKTPGNTPQARIQAIQLLMQAVPIPGTGLKPYSLVKVAIQEMDLNAFDVQMTEEEMMAQQQAQAMQMQPGQPPMPPQGPSMEGLGTMTPGQGIPGLPSPNGQMANLQ